MNQQQIEQWGTNKQSVRCSAKTLQKTAREQQGNSLAALLICPLLNPLIRIWVGTWGHLPKLQSEREYKLQRCFPEV